MLIYDGLKNKKPKKIALKERDNGEFLIVESKALQIYYLNETAKLLMDLCDGIRTVEDIKRELLAIYDVEETVLKNDIVDIIRDLQWKSLLRLG